MRKNFLRVLSCLMAVVMLLSFAPLGSLAGLDLFSSTASAAWNGNYQYTISNGEVTISNSVLSISGDLIIPDTIEGLPVTSIGREAFSGCTSLTGVTIPDSVRTIGYRAFYNCTGLNNVTIGNGVTNIGGYAFYDCDSLTNIVIPDSVTRIEYDAFNSCDGLKNVTIGNGVWYINSYAFAYCSNLENVTIGSSVSNIGYYAFYKCSSITKIVIPDSVTEINVSAFYGCEALTDLTIGKGLKEVRERAFFDCKSLKEVTIPSNVSNFGSYVFGYYNNWSQINNFKILGYPGSAAQKYAKKYGFEFVSLEDDFPWEYEETDAEVTLTGYYGTSANVEIPSEINGKPVTTIVGEAFRSNTYFKNVTIPESVTSIGDYAFGGCKNLKSVTLPNSLTVLGQYAFSSCKNLTSITIPENLTFLDYGTFYYCSKLKDVVLPATLKGIGKEAFSKCSALANIEIPYDLEYIGNDAFKNTILQKIEVLNPNTDIYGKNTIPPRTEIRGYMNSFAYDYAQKNNRQFTSLENIESISIESMPFKTQYKIGTMFNTEGLTVRVNYPDGKTMVKSKGFDIGNFYFDQTGTHTITVSCSDKTAQFDVEVTDGTEYQISNDERIKIEIIPGEVTCIKFVPKLSGEYWLNAVSGKDTFGYLYDENMKLLRQADNGMGGNRQDFSFIEDLYAGRTYYFGARYNNEALGGSFDLQLSCGYLYCLHENTMKIDLQPATCTEDGFVNGVKCLDCGKIISSEETLYAIGHDYILKNHVEPTCTDNGYDEYACSVCGDTYTYTRLEDYATGHNESDWIIDREATCTSEGRKHTECTVCHKIMDEDYISQIDHNYILKNHVAPTCTDDGYDEYVCSVCGGTEIRYTGEQPIGHVESGWIVDKESTCVTDGSRHIECTVCHEKIKTETIPAKNHNWVDTTTAATCTTSGYVTRSCLNCGFSYIKEITAPASHQKSGWIIDKEPTCTQEGKKHTECTVCHEIINTETISVKAHKWVETKTEPTCTAVGFVTSSCSDCGLSYIKGTVPSTGHKAVTVTGKAATCTESGLADGTKCSLCGETIKEQQVLKPNGHTFSEWVTTEEATYVSQGKQERKCTVCGIVEAKTTAKLVPASISVCTVSAVSSLTYTGKALAPTVAVKNGEEVLEPGTHYTVTYKNNIEIGKATITINGIEKTGYTGTKTLTFNIIPAAVKSLKATQTPTSVKLTWGKVPGAQGYRVFRLSGKKWVKVADTKSTSYTVSKLKSGTNYKYAVKAYAKSGSTTYYSASYTSLSTATRPGTPTIKATAGSKKAALKWNKQSGATGYVVYMATSKNGKYSRIATVKGSTKVSCTKTGLTKGKTYYFKVAAYKTVSGKNIYGSYSKIVSVKAK